MNPYQRTNIIFQICEKELRSVDPSDQDILRAAILGQIIEAENEMIAVKEPKKPEKPLPNTQMAFKTFKR